MVIQGNVFAIGKSLPEIQNVYLGQWNRGVLSLGNKLVRVYYLHGWMVLGRSSKIGSYVCTGPEDIHDYQITARLNFIIVMTIFYSKCHGVTQGVKA